MRHYTYIILIIGCLMSSAARAQHQFKGTSLSEALIALDNSSKRYDISFLYDELEDFTVTKNIRKSSSLPEAVREVCGFYPVKVTVKGHDILVECIQKDKTKLTGRLVNGGNQAIAYANILLLSPSDSTVLGGGVSNEAGDFVIPCSAREARVRISCVGYHTLERTLPIGNVGTLRMSVANNRLGAVTVSGQAPIIRNEADRVTYVVKHDQFAHELTALEVLNRVPMISVTGGKASILGKGEAHFMLNGRIMEQGSETIRQKLWSLRAEDIERIEVISVPSGKYQTEGEGFINIVLNPANTEGWRADVSARGALNDGFTNDHRKSTFSEQINASLNYGSRQLDFLLDVHQNKLSDAKQTVFDYTDIDCQRFGQAEPTNKHIYRRTDNSDKNWGIDAMLRYHPQANIELGAMFSIQNQRLEIGCGEDLPQYKFNSYSYLNPIDPAKSFSFTTYGDWTFDKMGKKLNITYNYFKRRSTEELSNYCYSYDSIYKIIYGVKERIDESSSETSTKYQLHDIKIDLTLPFKQFKIDAGFAYTIIKNPSWNGNNYSSTFSSIVYNENNFNYREHTLASYLTLQKDFINHRLSTKLGVRFERTWYKGEEDYTTSYDPIKKVSKDENNRSYSEILPTLHLNYRLGGHHQLSLAYGIGINRPNLHDLNPLRFYTTYTDYVKGNPSLLHSKTSSLELSYNNGRNFYVTAYHHKGYDQVEWITEFFLGPDWSYTITDSPEVQQITYPINCTNNKKTGINLRYQHRFSSMFSATIEGDGYHYDATASYRLPYNLEYASAFPIYATDEYKEFYENTQIYSSVKGWGGHFSLNSDLFLNKKHTWMVSGRYDQWFNDYQGLSQYDAYGYFSFAIRCSLLRDRLKLSLVATDPFHQYVTESHRSFESDINLGENRHVNIFDEHVHINHHLTNVSLTATFQLFNHTKVNYKK